VLKAVILAGGKGTRLKPYTTVFPKPLMPIGDKPILEIIIRQLKAHGIEDIALMVGHLGELVMAFFGDGSKFGVNIHYFKEETPLGTVGGLSLLKGELDDSFLMINGDTLTTLNFSEFMEYHRSNSAIATITLCRRRIDIDFGVVEVDRSIGQIKGYTEKPTIERLVSIGVNALQPQILAYIYPNKYMDFPSLVHNLLANERIVKAYIFDGYWLDIGRPEDYEQANIEIEKISGQLGIG